MKITDTFKKITFAEYVLYATLFLVGAFHVYLSCLLSVTLIIRLLIKYKKSGSLKINLDLTLISMLVLVGAYAMASLWAVDKGFAVFGFFKFLPLVLYLIVLAQEPDSKEKVMNNLPYMITVMMLISVICMYIPFLKQYFAVSDRLSGFIQYPNTFAIILLMAELLLITKEKHKIWDYIAITLLLFGILYTGSRTVFVLAVASNFVAILINKNKLFRRIVLGCIGVGIILVLLYCLITDNMWVLSRYLKISTLESTFMGRLLYAQDALPVILSHPFGLGYMGHYFIQQSIQTGVYAVMFIHNDYLQILLDVGWLPLLVFLSPIVMTLINKNCHLRYKLILVTLLIHSLFDFNLQYIAVFMILLLLLAPKGKTKNFTLVKKHRAKYSFVLILLICLCAYFGVAQGLTRFELHSAATKWYNHNTLSDIELIKDTPDTSKAEEIADRILKRNSYVALSYSVKARAAYAKGDFANVIKYKNKTFNVAPFAHAEYWEYGEMLVNGIKLYEQAGDKKSVEFCKKELTALWHAVPALKNRLSKYGALIDTQPRLYFPKELSKQIQEIIGEG